MGHNSDSRVLAVGIDAAEPTLIKQLIEQDKLPVLKSLLSNSKWLRVESPANIGSGSVWPTFITGVEPADHGVYGEWAWQPEDMGLRRYSGRHLDPFWRPLVKDGFRVGTLDIPFSPFIGFNDGFEVCEWGPHDLLEGQLRIAPNKAEIVAKEVPSHPLLLERLDTGGPRDYEGHQRLMSESLRGVKLRGKLARSLIAQTDPHLAVIGFSEIHHSAHYTWHTINPTHPLYESPSFKDLNSIQPSLIDIYIEVDRQIGGLIDEVGPDATVMVFSLHGMRPTHGVPSFVAPLFNEMGYSRFAVWSSQSWSQRAIELLAKVKRHAPESLKKIYYRTLSPNAAFKLALPTMMPPYDWQHTRAFSLPADQHGWVHVNLIGRESKGSVPPEQYEQLCQELEQMLKALRADDGRLIVRDVIRTAGTVKEALRQRLPDLVLHWEDVAFSSPLRIRDSNLVTEPAGQKFTGRHARDGFCILKGAASLHHGDTLRAAEMHYVIKRGLGIAVDQERAKVAVV
jgi:predicted AlkP superfamily phosphohydrolase/phosphomutase